MFNSVFVANNPKNDTNEMLSLLSKKITNLPDTTQTPTTNNSQENELYQGSVDM